MSKMQRFKSYFKIYESEETKAVFEQNERKANKLAVVVIIDCAVILVLATILNFVGLFTVPLQTMLSLAVQGVIELAIPFVLYLIFKDKHAPWLKYVMLFGLTLVFMRLYSILNHNVVLVMAIPLFLSARYCSKGLTMITAALNIIGYALAAASTVFYGIIDLNLLPKLPEGTQLTIKDSLRATLIAQNFDQGQLVRKALIDGFMPRLLVYCILAMIAVLIAQHGFQMVMDQNKIARASAAAKVELETATQIQNGMVPSIFPAYPERNEFDIYASMDTAKEVGGDFYDFFLIDDDHLGMVMADVSGKGVPAALFMMASKILINDRTLMGGTPAEILQFVNHQICSNNQAEMFVTVWLGILEISTGKVIAANAGHEYPAIYRAGKGFELYKDKHGFVIGGMDGVRYKDYEFTLGKGDALYLYTDGVTEATNAKGELFSVERMLNALNVSPESSTEELLNTIKSRIDQFVAEAPQFDDITMMCVRYNGAKPVTDDSEKEVSA